MKQLIKVTLLFVTTVVTVLACGIANASDHDDGETDLKGRDLNLTDVYAFREDKEGTGGSANNLVFIVNSNPRSIPQFQYSFSTTAYYDLHISRAGTNKAAAATTNDNVILRFQFGMPNTSGQQAITVTTIIDGVSTVIGTSDAGVQMLTTNLANGSAGTNTLSNLTVNGKQMTVFAGLRRDPFFFDVKNFFTFRSAAASHGAGTVSPTTYGYTHFPVITKDGAANALGTAEDFTSGYNVNSIAIRVPFALLQTAALEKIFDIWATVSVPMQ